MLLEMTSDMHMPILDRSLLYTWIEGQIGHRQELQAEMGLCAVEQRGRWGGSGRQSGRSMFGWQ